MDAHDFGEPADAPPQRDRLLACSKAQTRRPTPASHHHRQPAPTTPKKWLSSPFGGDFAVAATRNPCYQGTSRPQLRHHELHTPRAGSVPLSAQLARTAATGRPRSTSTARVSAPSATAKPSKRRGSEGR